MASLESRVIELERQAAASQARMQFLVILCGFGDEGVPLETLTHGRTGRVFTREPQEAESDFTARVEAALCTEETPLVVVTRNRGAQHESN